MRVQSGEAAAPHLRPGFRSLRSPAAAGATDGQRAGPTARPQAHHSLRKRGLAQSDARTNELRPPRAPAPRTLGRRGSAALMFNRSRRPVPPCSIHPDEMKANRTLNTEI